MKYRAFRRFCQVYKSRENSEANRQAAQALEANARAMRPWCEEAAAAIYGSLNAVEHGVLQSYWLSTQHNIAETLAKTDPGLNFDVDAVEKRMNMYSTIIFHMKTLSVESRRHYATGYLPAGCVEILNANH